MKRDQNGELEQEDITINSKLVLAEMSTWFDEIAGDEGDASGGGEDGDGVNCELLAAPLTVQSLLLLGLGGGGGDRLLWTAFHDVLVASVVFVSHRCCHCNTLYASETPLTCKEVTQP